MTPSDDDNNNALIRVTTFASNIIGSWWMIIFQTIIIGTWIFLTSANLLSFKFDNERFDTLRLMLALQSVYTTPLILMAQRRLLRKDRKVLYDLADEERVAMHIRREAQSRRIRLEEKIDRLLEKFDK